MDPPSPIALASDALPGWASIRPARAADRDAVAEIVAAAYAPYVARIGRRPRPMDDDYAALIAAGRVHVLTLAGAVAGLAVLAARADHLFLDSVAVAPALRGRGLGRALLQFAEARAAALGLDTLRLHTNAAMTENRALYARIGYVETGRGEQAGFARIFMQKRLAAADPRPGAGGEGQAMAQEETAEPDAAASPDETALPAAARTGTGRFDIAAIARGLPESATTLLVDTYLTDGPAASARVFRVYRPTPPHYHATCDEFLYVVSGRGTFWMGEPGDEAPFGPGELLVFPRGTVHAIPTILAEPMVFLSIDTPRREPTDIVFVNPEDGTPATFMARNAGG